MFYTFNDIVRFCRTFRGLPCEVSEELRGWSWSSPPVLYPYGFPISVSDIASGFCDSGRHVYLKYVSKERERENWRLTFGKIVHVIISETSRLAKSLILNCIMDVKEFKSEFLNHRSSILSRLREKFKDFENLEPIFDLLWNRAMDTFSSELAKAKSRSPYLSPDGMASLVVPFTSEFPVDGSLIGLSKTLRIDLMIYPNIIVEIKTREWREDYKLSLSGYALAFESQYEIPVNYGIIALLRFNLEDRDMKVYERIVRIDDNLRQAFIDRRDFYAKIIEDGIDPGRARECNPDCPYLHICSQEG